MVLETGPISFSFDGEPLYHLFGTYTRYSSWTARVTTVLEHFRIPYKATYIPNGEVKRHSPSGLVPLLTPLTGLSQGVQVNDSLAILLHLAEAHPELPLWPTDAKLRTLARSAVCEMHSGFSRIRNKFHTTFVAQYSGNIPISPEETKEVERLLTIFDQARAATETRVAEGGVKDEGYLFGEWGIADAYFWPVLWRFRTYNLPLTSASPRALAWFKKMWEDPILKDLGKDYFAQLEIEESKLLQYDDLWKDDSSVDIVYKIVDNDWNFSGPKE